MLTVASGTFSFVALLAFLAFMFSFSFAFVFPLLIAPMSIWGDFCKGFCADCCLPELRVGFGFFGFGRFEGWVLRFGGFRG